jgi:hypothetical protein
MIDGMHFLADFFNFMDRFQLGHPPQGKSCSNPHLPQIHPPAAIFNFSPIFTLFPSVLRFYGRRTFIDGIYSFYVSVICLSCTLFCAYRLIWTGRAIFDFSPFFTLFPRVLGFYGRGTIINGIYSFYVSVICLSCTPFCAYRLIWTGTAIFDFLLFFSLFPGVLGFYAHRVIIGDI